MSTGGNEQDQLRWPLTHVGWQSVLNSRGVHDALHRDPLAVFNAAQQPIHGFDLGGRKCSPAQDGDSGILDGWRVFSGRGFAVHLNQVAGGKFGIEFSKKIDTGAVILKECHAIFRRDVGNHASQPDGIFARRFFRGKSSDLRDFG